MSKLYRLKSDHAVECSLREPGTGSWVFLVRDCVPRGTLEQPWDRSYFDKLWEPIPESAPPSPVLVEDELGRFAGQLDGWLTVGPFNGKALAAFLRRAAADLRRLRWEKTFVGGVIPTKARYRGQRIWIETLGDGNADLDMQRQFEILAEMGLILSVDK